MSKAYTLALEKLGMLPVEIVGFDPVPHLIRMLVLAIGKHLYPTEQDLTKLYEDVGSELGLIPVQLIPAADYAADSNTSAAKVNIAKAPNHLPTIGESVPMTTCPKCKAVAVRIEPICPTCEDADGGKNKTKYYCTNEGCDYKELSKKPYVVALQETGFKLDGMISKRALGARVVLPPGRAGTK